MKNWIQILALSLVVFGFANSAFATVLNGCKVTKIYAERDRFNSLSEYVNYELSCPTWAGPFRIHNNGGMATKLLLMAKQTGDQINVDFDSDPRQSDEHHAFPATKIELQ